MPFSLNPLHYVLAGLIILLLVISTYAWITSSQLDAVTAEYNGFKATQKALGEAAIAKNAETEKQYNTLKKDTDNAITTLTLANDDLAKRLRDDRSRSRAVSIQTAFAGKPEATCKAAELSAALQRLDDEVSTIARECDQAAGELSAVRDWALQVGDTGSK